MSNTVKLTLYVFLAVLAGISGFFALGQWKSVMDRPPVESELERIENEPASARPTPQDAAAGTNAPGESSITNSTATNSTALTGVESEVTNGVPPAETAAATNATATSAITPDRQEENLEDVDVSVPTALGGRGNPEEEPSRIGLWSGLFLLSLVGLAILIGLDVSHYFGNKALTVMYNDEGHGMGNPDYEAAEQVWADGDHLEAIRMMREYLQKNPREQFVALRIAEIYEKDLGNHLAAALEYEEVLKHKLQPDRWGWSAIHLCNLYFKLGQEAKAFALLRRIVDEYPQTPAAEKARKRLEEVDGSALPPQELTTENEVSQKASPAPPEDPKSNLPPGFRPKK